jgi:hypothetical protein
MKIPKEILDKLQEEGSFAVLVLLCSTKPPTLRIVSTPGSELAEFTEKNAVGIDEPIGLLLYTTDDGLPFIVVLEEAADRHSEEKVKKWLWVLADEIGAVEILGNVGSIDTDCEELTGGLA